MTREKLEMREITLKGLKSSVLFIHHPRRSRCLHPQYEPEVFTQKLISNQNIYVFLLAHNSAEIHGSKKKKESYLLS